MHHIPGWTRERVGKHRKIAHIHAPHSGLGLGEGWEAHEGRPAGSEWQSEWQVDREGATAQRCNEVESQIFDLFAQMGATDEQLDFPVLYASGRQARASPSPHSLSTQPNPAFLTSFRLLLLAER